MIPLRARAKELKSAADAWAASKAPEMVPSCASEGVRRMVDKVAHESKAIVAMLDAQVDDTWLMAQFKRLHSSFEAAEGHAVGTAIRERQAIKREHGARGLRRCTQIEHAVKGQDGALDTPNRYGPSRRARSA
jgi:hypothetical protein